MEVDEQKIASVAFRPDRDGAAALVGSHSSRRFRSSLDAALPEERAAGSPLYFMLDDVAIVSRIGGIAWSQHRPPVLPQRRRGLGGAQCRPGAHPPRPRPVLGAPAGRLQRDQLRGEDRLAAPLPARRRPDQSKAIPGRGTSSIRRPRCASAAAGGSTSGARPDSIELDAHYRDSVWGDQHTELSLHEYSLKPPSTRSRTRCSPWW